MLIDPNAPQLDWVEVNCKTPGGRFMEVIDFSTRFPIGSLFVVKLRLKDVNGDLSSCVLRAIGRDEEEVPLFVGGASGDVELVSAEFSLDEGDWTIIAQVADTTNRVTESVLAGGSDAQPVALRVRDGTSRIVANPIAIPKGMLLPQPVSVTLVCSTIGAAIEFQLVPLGKETAIIWQTYRQPIDVRPGSTLVARATAPGLETSPMVKHDYRLLSALE